MARPAARSRRCRQGGGAAERARPAAALLHDLGVRVAAASPELENSRRARRGAAVRAARPRGPRSRSAAIRARNRGERGWRKLRRGTSNSSRNRRGARRQGTAGTAPRAPTRLEPRPAPPDRSGPSRSAAVPATAAARSRGSGTSARVTISRAGRRPPGPHRAAISESTTARSVGKRLRGRRTSAGARREERPLPPLREPRGELRLFVEGDDARRAAREERASLRRSREVASRRCARGHVERGHLGRTISPRRDLAGRRWCRTRSPPSVLRPRQRSEGHPEQVFQASRGCEVGRRGGDPRPRPASSWVLPAGAAIRQRRSPGAPRDPAAHEMAGRSRGRGGYRDSSRAL